MWAGMMQMRRTLVLLALIVTVFAAPAPSLAQEAPGVEVESVQIRPPDPPLPEPVAIPDLVSDLIVVDSGQELRVSRLSANVRTEPPGSLTAVPLTDWALFAAPAVIPLLGAILVLVATRSPRRRSPATPGSA